MCCQENGIVGYLIRMRMYTQILCVFACDGDWRSRDVGVSCLFCVSSIRGVSISVRYPFQVEHSCFGCCHSNTIDVLSWTHNGVSCLARNMGGSDNSSRGGFVSTFFIVQFTDCLSFLLTVSQFTVTADGMWCGIVKATVELRLTRLLSAQSP